jgi:hypothetical protein
MSLTRVGLPGLDHFAAESMGRFTGTTHIEHYRSGGRTIKTGPRAGIDFDNPNKSEFVKVIRTCAWEGRSYGSISVSRAVAERSVRAHAGHPPN